VTYRIPRLALAVLGGVACLGVTTPDGAGPLPVVQGLLVVGQNRHSFTVTWSVHADSSFTANGPAVPVAGDQVNLSLRRPDGSLIALTLVNPAIGEFEVVTPVLPLTRYELTGSVAGHAVSGSVTTPGEFLIAQPAGDTVRATATPGLGRSIPYRWRAQGAAAFTGAAAGLSIVPESDSTGVLRFFALGSDTVAVTLLALERDAAAFFLPGAIQARPGNLAGVRGALGAASYASRVFVWQ
jgi:hypothetical protein